jgi:hypothetical protein
MKVGGLGKPFSRPWMEKVTRYIVTGKRVRALRLLDSVIEDLPLFRKNDPSIVEERRLGWLYRIDLLIEWGRTAEALAWTCLECDLNPGNVAALAMKERLKAALDLSETVSPIEGSESVNLRHSWKGVAGMRDVKIMLERDVILPLEEPELYKRFKVDLPNGILFMGRLVAARRSLHGSCRSSLTLILSRSNRPISRVSMSTELRRKSKNFSIQQERMRRLCSFLTNLMRSFRIEQPAQSAITTAQKSMSS